MFPFRPLTLHTALCVLALTLCAAAQPTPAQSCRSIVIQGELSANERFQKAISPDLVFELAPEPLGPQGNLNGWRISLSPAQDRNRDYIYPVNPPLRFNGLQILGPSYGDDTKTSLGHAHEMRFLLSAADYDRIWPLVTNALWPYSAPRPEKTAEEYSSALQALTTGRLRFTVAAYDADPETGSIRHIRFSAEFTAPASFAFDAQTKAQAAACPAASE